MASIWMLEDVVIIGGLCLLCSAIALTLLTLLQDEGLKDIVRGIFRRFVSKNTNNHKRQKRLKKEQENERIDEKTQSNADNISWQEIFTVNTTPALSELKQHVVNTALIRPCSKCNDYNAKKNCQFNCCAICCRSNPYSVCKAHKTGYQSAITVVEEAVKYGYPEVDISYCHLKQSPPRLTSLGKYVVSLNLSNNRLSTLPEDIGSLTGLQELFLQYNHLTCLPTSVCQLTRLVELDIKNNMLTHIPNDIGHLTSLTILCLMNNFLSSLPTSIGQLVHLEELSLHSNLLKTLPDEVCQLQDLKFLYCGENKLQNLPNQFGKLVKLEELDLSGCELTKLPESLCYCKLLIRLWLTNNKLVSLPTHIGNLRQLKELHVRKNCLRVFPLSIKKLTLYTFTAQNNPTLKEHQLTQFSHTPKIKFPPLLELAGRTLIREKITWRRGYIPISLEEMLMCSSSCTQCGGPILTYYTCQVSFHLVGVFYRLPLYEQLCSPHNTSICGGIIN